MVLDASRQGVKLEGQLVWVFCTRFAIRIVDFTGFVFIALNGGVEAWLLEGFVIFILFM